MGRRRRYIDKMIALVSGFLYKPIKISRLMETEPVGVSAEQQWFLNCIVSGKYDGTPEELLAECLGAEQKLGRVRGKQFAPRTADIDVLMFGNRRIGRKTLTVPHPCILARRFCLEGLREIAPRTKIAGTGLTCDQHYRRMPQRVRVQKIRFLAW